MDRLDLSDAYLETLSDSDVVRTSNEIGMTVPRRGEPRQDTLRRIRTLRDRSMRTTKSSERELERYPGPSVSRRTHMCITVQAVVIAGVSTCVLWYNLASWSFNKYLSVYGLKGALERRVWIDYLSLFVFLVLVILWFGPARKLGPMYFYLPPSSGSRPLRLDPSTDVKPTEDDPTSIPTQKIVGRDLPASSSSKDDVMLSQGSERQPITNAGTEPDPVTIPQGFDRSSAEVESIRSERDMLQGRLRQATEQAEAAKGNAAASEKKMLKMQKELEDDKKRLEGNAVASEEKMLKMQKEIEDKKKRLEEMELQVDISEERSRKTLKETKRENEKLRAELIRLRGKVWFYLRLRPKVDRDKENQYLDLTSPDDFHHSLNLPGGIDEKHPIDTHYEFDRVFHHTDTNHDVYEHVRPMVQAAMEGLDVAIILEGPSGSGKSYTMFEQPDGIAFSVARHILQLPSDGEGSSGQMQIRISNFKVYMENILDATISKGENPPLHVREEKDTKIQVYRDKRCAARVEGKLVSSKEQLTSEFVRILKAREQRETAQNATSSRSHAVCKLDFLSYNVEAGEARTSSLFLVDLAGPESYEQSPNPEETKNITKGRTELQHRLCEMIQLHQLDLSSPKRKEKTQALRLQLKNSKLTRILQDCFLGEPRILVIGTVNPYAADEHRSRIRDTFEFATKIRSYNLGSDHARLEVRPN